MWLGLSIDKTIMSTQRIEHDKNEENNTYIDSATLLNFLNGISYAGKNIMSWQKTRKVKTAELSFHPIFTFSKMEK